MQTAAKDAFPSPSPTAHTTATRLMLKRVEKPWGRHALPDIFENPDNQQIGEIWFESPAGRDLPLLAKYIFTSEKLSVQVHPDDAQALANGLPGGKSECWYVLDAEPGACLGIGTTVPLTPAELRSAALDGSIEGLMDWKPVSAGHFYYIPAGTIHAIGAGVTLLEVQQNNDITYRLYDYGRPRPLHLDEGVAVTRAEPFPDPVRVAPLGTQVRLVNGTGAPFTMDMIAWAAGDRPALPETRPCWFLPVSGSGTIDGAPWSAQQCWLIDGDAALSVDTDCHGFLACAA